MVLPSSSNIEGFSWQDLNRDGVIDNNEPVLEGVTVYLDSNANGSLDTDETQTVTDSNGRYEFNDLVTGLYQVRAENLDQFEVISPSTDTPTIPFTGLTEDNRGLIAYSTIDNIGHSEPIPGLTDSYAFYYLASPEFNGVNPDSIGAVQGIEPAVGFNNLTEALADNNLTLEDLNVKVSELSLGDDVLGEDWFAEDNLEIRYYTGGNLTLQIDGEDALVAPIERFTLILEYNNIENSSTNDYSGWVDLGSLENISQDSSGSVQTIVEALLTDINERDTNFLFNTLQTSAQANFAVGNEVFGSFYELDDVAFTFADTPVVGDSAYRLIAKPGETYSDINFGLSDLIEDNSDFDNDGNADLVWRNQATGQNAVWYMDGINRIGSKSLPSVANTDWELKATNDFNNDNHPDLVWRNQATGQNAVWYMDGTNRIGSALFDPVNSANWDISGVGDFNNDNNSDLVWRNQATGQNAVWYMDGTNRIGSALFDPVNSANWDISGVGDFNNDNNPDLVWRNGVTGRNVFWYMDDTTRISSADFDAVTNTDWILVA
ncbi:SdrD B-like domain-containing protein [Myxosarcina sp. GI1]|uniref:SdrD B-like domain-containing protein n=1 Tax=Myxosarcina sp. GI1 TaxID=1541065 RepID=UPI00068FF39D|nr:SdrD B-like domain-containing protein [Myxosarcina sp. GI1]